MYFWLCSAGFAESVGEGLMLVGAYAYVCHEATGLSSGRRFGSVMLVVQVSNIFVDYWLYLAKTNSAFWIMWGGVAMALVALSWWYMPEEYQRSGKLNPFTEPQSYTDCVQKLLPFLPFAAVASGFAFGCEYLSEYL